MAWGQVGRFVPSSFWTDHVARTDWRSRLVPDDELNLVLATLVEFLGHSNQIIPAIAVNEVDTAVLLHHLWVSRVLTWY